jgi:hypothetical protein
MMDGSATIKHVNTSARIVNYDRPRFVTAGPISIKLGGWIPLGNTPISIFDFRDLTYFVASRRPSLKSDFCHLRANGCS